MKKACNMSETSSMLFFVKLSIQNGTGTNWKKSYPKKYNRVASFTKNSQQLENSAI